MASITTNAGRYRLVHGSTGPVDLLVDTVKIGLLGTGYTPDKDHAFVSDVSASELSGTGYASGFSGSGRKTLSTKTLTQDNTNDVVKFDADDVVYSAINAGTIGFIFVYKNGTSDADSPLLMIIDVTDTPTNGGDITIVWAALGILNWS